MVIFEGLPGGQMSFHGGQHGSCCLHLSVSLTRSHPDRNSARVLRRPLKIAPLKTPTQPPRRPRRLLPRSSFTHAVGFTNLKCLP